MSSGVILATASYDHTIRFWEAPSGQCYHQLQFPESQINKLAVTHNKEFMAAAGHHIIRLYHISNNNQTPVVGSFDGHKGNVQAIGFQIEDKWMYSGAEDHTMRIWDMRSLRSELTYTCDAPVTDVALHPNQGELITTDENGKVQVWDLTANKCVFSTQPDRNTTATSVSISKNGKRCTVANIKGDVYVYALHREESLHLKLLKKIEAHRTYVLKCLISPNVRQLATASADHTVKLWDMQDDTFTLQRTLKGHKKWVWDCSYSSDSAYLVTASSDMTAKLWDLSKGESIKDYKGHQKPVVCITLND